MATASTWQTGVVTAVTAETPHAKTFRPQLVEPVERALDMFTQLLLSRLVTDGVFGGVGVVVCRSAVSTRTAGNFGQFRCY